MAKFEINEHYANAKTIEAEDFHTNGDFVDFMDAEGDIVFRMASSKVETVRRKDA